MNLNKKTIEIHSIADFCKGIRDANIYPNLDSYDCNSIAQAYMTNKNVFWGGQHSKYRSIIASLSRELGYIKNEKYICKETIDEYQREFKTFSQPIQKLAKMQHYGIPTRLIDFTVNPLVALFLQYRWIMMSQIVPCICTVRSRTQ